MRLRGTLLHADRDSRILRYRLLPYGEPGITNMGRIIAEAGALELPHADQLVLNVEHDRHRPLGRGVELTETADALDVAFRVLATSAGDDHLIEAAEGVRDGISVEVEDPVIRDGHLIGGRLTGAGAVVDPAFDSARLAAASLPLAPDTTPDVTPDMAAPTSTDTPDTPPDVTPDTSPTEGDTDDDDTDEADDLEDDMDTEAQGVHAVATAPRLAASRVTAAPAAAPAAAPLSLMGAMQILVRMRAGDHTDAARLEPAGQLFAAFGDATTTVQQADVDAASQPQWIGELWSPADYTRRIIPLISSAPLTSLRLQGYKWTTKPTVGKYAGAPAEITSTPVTLAPVNEAAQRWAGGNRIDRSITDFPDAGVLASYLRLLAVDYAQKSDEDCLAELLAAATPITAGTVPPGQAAGWAAILDGALALIEFGTPSFAVLDPTVWRDMAFTTDDDSLAFLSQSLGLANGTMAGFPLVPHPALLGSGQVLVGIKQAATHYELPGSPLRVNALAISVGAFDEAVFAYDGTIVADARGLALIDLVP